MNKKSNIMVGAALIGVLGIGAFAYNASGNIGGKEEKALNQVESVKIVEEAPEANVIVSTAGSFVASKQGKKYFPTDCGSAKTIKEENKIYFESSEEAEQAGYERSLTCK